jgi:hypothetical protein
VKYRKEHAPTCPKDTLSLKNAAIGSRWKCRGGLLIEVVDVQYFSNNDQDPSIEVAEVGDPDNNTSLWHKGYMNYTMETEWDVIASEFDECPY